MVAPYPPGVLVRYPLDGQAGRGNPVVASDLGVGDVETATLVVAPADTDTVATLTVTAPDGTTIPVTVSGGPLEPIDGSDDKQQTWASDEPVVYDAAGKWVLHWDVTGTGEGAEDLEVWVVASPTAGGPTWLPGRSRVAAYVPRRTLVRSVSSTVESADQYAWTFDSTTTPTGLEVSRLIADGASWIFARVTPMAASSEALASTICAIYAAAMVERNWPEDDNALQRANDLERRMDAMLADLIAANNASNGTDDFGLDVAYPVWSFSAPDPRYDDARYW